MECAEIPYVRLVLVFLLLAGSGVLAVRHVQGHRHSFVIPVLLVPGLVLGWFEYEDRRADQALSAAATVLVGRPVSVDCQRFGAAMLDGGAELGRVAFGPDGRPDDTAIVTYQACQALHAWLGVRQAEPDPGPGGRRPRAGPRGRAPRGRPVGGEGRVPVGADHRAGRRAAGRHAGAGPRAGRHVRAAGLPADARGLPDPRLPPGRPARPDPGRRRVAVSPEP